MGISRVPSFSNRPGFPAGLRILLVEPNEGDLRAIASQLRECNYEVSECTSEVNASRTIESCKDEFDLIICEASVVPNDPDVSSAFARTACSVPLVLTGENTSQEQKLVGIRFGAMDFLEKPVALLKLRNVWQHTVRKMLKKQPPASLVEGDVSTGKKGRQGGFPVNSRTELCKTAALSESAQESTGSSQGDQIHCSKSKADAAKSKSDRKCSGELRAVRRSASGSARSMSVSKSVSTKPAPVSGAAPPPVTDQASARGDASTGDAVATQQRPEVVPTQQPHSQQKSQHVQQLQPVAAAPHPPHAQAPDMPMGANGMVPPNGMLSYGLHGMPPPLPGCVWGLPMLPPPVPGLMGAPMMAAPHTKMMPGAHPDHCAHMPWGQPVAGPSMHAMGHSVATAASSAPHSMPQRALSAPLASTAVAVPALSAAVSGGAAASGSVTVVPGAANTSGTLTPKASGSLATWSHDASTATHLGDMAWAEVDVDVDVFGLGSNAGDLHEFSDSLLQAGETTEADKSGTSRQDKRSNVGGEKLMDGDEELGGEGLSWMDEDCLMDDLRPLGEQGTFLDVMT